MKKIRLAIIGLGNLGHKCAEAIFADQSTELAGIVQRTITSSAIGLNVSSIALTLRTLSGANLGL